MTPTDPLHSLSARGATPPQRQSIDPQLPSLQLGVLMGMIAFSALAMVVVLPVGFLFHYFMNDQVTWRVHLSFLTGLICSVLALGALYVRVMRELTGLPVRRCLAGGFTAAAFLPLLLGSVYALLSVLPPLNSAIGYTTSNLTCLLVCAALGATAAACLGTARAAMREAPTTP